MSQSECKEQLRIKLEELGDSLVVNGARQEDVFDAIVERAGFTMRCKG